jgi:hypothetical protein
MSIFTNPFFSIAGQVERIKNVGATLNAAFNPFASVKGVTANVSNPTVKAVLETVASHPYVSAGVVAAGVTAVSNPSAALAVAKKLVPKSTLGKVAAVTIAPTVIGGVTTAIKNSPTKALDLALSAPSKGFNAGQDLNKIIQEPSLQSGIDYIKAHPYFSAAAITVGLAAIGFSSVTIASLLSNHYNTKAVIENTKATDQSNNPIVAETSNSDYKDQLKIIDAQTKQQITIIEAQTAQAKELSKINVVSTSPSIPAVVAPLEAAPAGSSIKKTVKKKKKSKKKTKKKTRRSKKKTSKKKKKSIKRNKS